MCNVTAVQDQGHSFGLVNTGLGQRQDIPHVLYLLEVEGHVRGQHHVDDEGPELAELVSRQVLQDIAVIVLHYPKKNSNQNS